MIELSTASDQLTAFVEALQAWFKYAVNFLVTFHFLIWGMFMALGIIGAIFHYQLSRH